MFVKRGPGRPRHYPADMDLILEVAAHAAAAAIAARDAATMRRERDATIVRALADGASHRVVARAAGLSHQVVDRIGQAGRARRPKAPSG